MLNFQPPPDPGEAVRNRWQGSIDDIFNAYQRAKAIKEQRRSQDIQDLMNYGFQTRNLTPEDFQKAQEANQAQSTPMVSQGMLGHGPLNLPSDATRTSGLNPTVQALGAYLEKKKKMEAMTMAQSQAGLGKTQAESAKLLSEAGNFYTPQQAALAMNPQASQEELNKLSSTFAGAFPRGKLPKDYVHAAVAGNKSGMMMGEKEKQYNQKRLTAFGDALDVSKASSRSPLGVSKLGFDRAERLQSLSNAFLNNNLDSRQIEELAIGLNSMLQGSNVGAMEQVRALVPKTIIGNVQKFKEWLVNSPQGLNQQEFVKRLGDTIAREKATMDDQIKRTLMQRVNRYSDLEKSAPDEFYNALQNVGIDSNEYHKWKSGGYKPISAVQSPEGAPKPADAIDALINKHLGGM